MLEELRGQQEEIVRQVALAKDKPAWDDALRAVVDVAFDCDSSLAEVSEANHSPTPMALRPFSPTLYDPCSITSSQVVLEQLIEGGSLSPDDHIAATLLLHPERHGHLFVAECTKATASFNTRLKENAEWSRMSSRLPAALRTTDEPLGHSGHSARSQRSRHTRRLHA